MPIDHTSIVVPPSQLEEMVAFYKAALAPLDYVEVMRPIPTSVGLGIGYKADFWLTAGDEREFPGGKQLTSLHFAFTVTDRTLADKFHAAALAAGGKDNGPPGPRPMYHENYYASFVRDPIGNNVEVVCHLPQE